MRTIQNLFTIHVQPSHVRCTSGHVPFDPGFCFVPVDMQPVYEAEVQPVYETQVQPVYETDGAPTQPWNVLFSVSSSFVTCDALLAQYTTSTQETV